MLRSRSERCSSRNADPMVRACAFPVLDFPRESSKTRTTRRRGSVPKGDRIFTFGIRFTFGAKFTLRAQLRCESGISSRDFPGDEERDLETDFRSPCTAFFHHHVFPHFISCYDILFEIVFISDACFKCNRDHVVHEVLLNKMPSSRRCFDALLNFLFKNFVHFSSDDTISEEYLMANRNSVRLHILHRKVETYWEGYGCETYVRRGVLRVLILTCVRTFVQMWSIVMDIVG